MYGDAGRLKEALPRYSAHDEYANLRHRRRHRRRLVQLVVATFIGYLAYHRWASHGIIPGRVPAQLDHNRLRAEYDHCATLQSVPKDPSGPRERNARYGNGQTPVLIRNATVWTGEPFDVDLAGNSHADGSYTWIHADVLLEHGLIKRVEDGITDASIPDDTKVYDAKGRLLTTGIVDMHSHAGDESLPGLRGSSDANELSSDITPYVRSIDGINPLDPQIRVIKSGGVTTSLILPGSGNNIGGEAYVIKHAVGKADGRTELSVESMLADPDQNWRYMKMACGENAKRVYGRVGRDFGPFSRLGEAWYFRHAFEQASKLVKAQDDWCATANRQIDPTFMPVYLPLDLQWESLAAVLRGQVHVNTHCYTVPDLEAFVRHTNEFRFPVRAFHHAHQTYLVPEILKRAYGNHTPAAALFADNMYYKTESYIASEQAGKILYENGVTPVYVSDNPVLNAQHVVFEAAKAYRYGLPYHAALAGVTSAPAALLGLGERVGKVKASFDADIVVWDSDPLSVGAAPVQVWIDGVPQFSEPFELKKAAAKPIVPDDGLQALPEKESLLEDIVFAGVTKIITPISEYVVPDNENSGWVVVKGGVMTCVGSCASQVTVARDSDVPVIEVKDGYLTPPFTAFGSFLGLEEIAGEEDTKDGVNDETSFSAAIDGLALGSKSLKAAYRHGVTRAISAPSFKGDGHKGVSVGFRTASKHQAEKGAVFAKEVALHYTLNLAAKQGKTPSLSSAVGELREKLLKAAHANSTDEVTSTEDLTLRKVVNGTLPLVITVHSADTIAALLGVKADVEAAGSSPLRLVVYGGAESHMLASELAAANVSIVLAPLLSYGAAWDERRALTGAPLTNGTAVDILHAAGVKLAIGTAEDWETRDLDLSAGIAHANSGGKIGEKEALALISSNVYEILGLAQPEEAARSEWVLHEGSPLEIGGRVKAVADGRGHVSVWT